MNVKPIIFSTPNEKMSMYQALYRKYRPTVFSDVVGQPHITRTLRQQVAEGRPSHAYLFTGSRGTGKTTCAKILSRAVNCEHPQDGDPCGQCAACLALESGNSLDVLELDAASNNGVDQIRSLRDEAVYPPANARKRVYIMDEVHTLSVPAFNALLKILEEPPEHLIFILATTEPQKVPATILSRCQRYAFRRIQPRDIAERLRYVARKERIRLTDDGAERAFYVGGASFGSRDEKRAVSWGNEKVQENRLDGERLFEYDNSTDVLVCQAPFSNFCSVREDEILFACVLRAENRRDFL